MIVLVVDIGGTSVKMLTSGQDERRTFPSGRTLTPQRMVAEAKRLTQDWKYDVVSIGYRAWSRGIGRSPNRETLDAAGSGLTLRAHSSVLSSNVRKETP